MRENSDSVQYILFVNPCTLASFNIDRRGGARCKIAHVQLVDSPDRAKIAIDPNCSIQRARVQSSRLLSSMTCTMFASL